jgi:hypothetical protein
MKRVLVVFVDGVGIGADDPGINAFAAVPPRRLTELLDGARIAGHTTSVCASGATLVPLDAQLGVSGLPQSGTGQFSLLTGSNGAAQFGGITGRGCPRRCALPSSAQSAHDREGSRPRRRVRKSYPEELIASALANGGRRSRPPTRRPPLAAAGADC